jgi:nicotinate-nucleotide--dimethylbenzimidazole phosphoribosyltransferase
MSREEASAAVLAGAEEVAGLAAGGEDDGGARAAPADLIVHGEMGLANTTAAAAIVAAVTGCEPAAAVGPGAGGDPATVERKAEVVAAGLARHRPDSDDPLGVLAAVGGLEHAALAGVALAAAGHRLPVVLDGISSLAAALLAVRLAPAATGYLIAGHRPAEPGAALALDALGLESLLDLGLRLGEGSGGLLAVPLVTAAARVLGDTATLDDLGLG